MYFSHLRKKFYITPQRQQRAQLSLLSADTENLFSLSYRKSFFFYFLKERYLQMAALVVILCQGNASLTL